MSTSSIPITDWLALGPIYNPDHQSASHSPQDGHPPAAEIISDIDNNPASFKPEELTSTLASSPDADDQVKYGGEDSLFASQTYTWQVVRFPDMDGDIHCIEDNIHQHLPNPKDKHHCLAFFLTYIHAPDTFSTNLCVRSDDAIRVWLNGAEIGEPVKFVGDRDITSNSQESCAEIDLREGWNILLVAVTETHAEWGFSVRIAQDADLIITPIKPAIEDKNLSLMRDRLALNSRGGRVVALHTDLKTLGYVIPTYEIKDAVYGVGTREAVLEFQTKNDLRRTGMVDEKTQAALARSVSVVKTDARHVEGRIFLENGRPASNLTLRLYHQGFGGKAKVTPLGEAKTDEQGYYHFAYPLSDNVGKAANLEVRVVEAGEKETSLSKTKFGADRHEIMNLVAPARLVTLGGSEYQRLTTALTSQVKTLDNLANARETDEQKDLTVLHQATGWDARLIALAALAVQRQDKTKMLPEALYALFRMGFPSNPEILAQVSPTTIEEALKKANEVGIVALDENAIDQAKAAFNTFAHTTILQSKAAGTLSSVSELLEISGLSDTSTGEDPSEREAFANLYFVHRDNPTELWTKTRDILQGNDEEKTAKLNRLQVQGKLAYLTLNNAPLIQAIQPQDSSPDDLTWLVAGDFYKSETWENRLQDIANHNEDTLKTLIPPAYSGKKVEDLCALYSTDMARKVHLSYPTQVVGRFIEKGELSISISESRNSEVSSLLKKASQKGFELGRQSLTTFTKQHPDIFKEDTDEQKQTLRDLKRLHRLYQITPSDEALIALAELKFKSANEIADLSPEVFRARVKTAKQPLSDQEIDLIYRKAQQVSAVTLNLVTTAQLMDSVPPIYGIFPAPQSPLETRRSDAKANLIKHYPSLETLFRSVDFCECEHCRSVLSPAAYFVDLLQFLEHPNDGSASKPYDALTQRRPDLPYLELSCENTHTALPYIDIVNEILEYWVAHFDEATHVNNKALDEKAVRNTGSATTPELLAEPQNILPEAYNRLREPTTCYPLNLPFDLWLETVRQFLNHFDTPLWQLLELLRPTDELFDPSVDYNRAAIFAEYLGISPSEYTIFTNPPQTNWYSLYGYKNAAAAKDNKVVDDDGQRVDLNSAKTLSRKLGVSYKELVELVATGFVNPNLDALVVLQKLGVSVEDVLQYLRYNPHAPGLSDAEKYRLAREHEAFQKRLDDLKEQYGFDVETWIGTQRTSTFEQIFILVDSSSGCDFNTTELKFTGSGAAGSDADELVFLKLNLFVRLWKKLGWSIDETDQALKVFLPGGIQGITTTNLGAALKTALIYLAHLKALDETLKLGKHSRQKLLTLWADMPTTGSHPLYAQLFLTQSILKTDPVFYDALGKYLCYFNLTSLRYEPFYWDATQTESVKNGNVSLKSHLPALQAALNLTADEIQQILIDNSQTLDNAALTLANVSLLYRYGLLAKALKLSVSDLISLKALSGLNPFQSLHLVTDPLTQQLTLVQDYPLTQTLAFVEKVETVKASGFSMEDLTYLLRHQFDPVGSYRPDPNAFLALVKTLAAGLRQIQVEHAVPEDTSSFTDDLLQQKLNLVLPADVAAKFFGMWTGAIEYEYTPEAPFDLADLGAVSALKDIRYDELHNRIIYQGVLTEADKNRLLDHLYPPPATRPEIVVNLLNHVQAQAQEFFETYLQKDTSITPHFGFLEPDHFELLFGSASPDKDKRDKLAPAFLTYLQDSLSRQLVVQTLATSLKADSALAEALLTHKSLLADPSGQPWLPALTELHKQGVTAEFFASNDCTGVPATVCLSEADTNSPLKPSTPSTKSARLEGYLEVPTTGAYRFYGVCSQANILVELRFEHLVDPVFRATSQDGDEIHEVVPELKAGVPYHFTLNVQNLSGGNVALKVLGETLPKGSLSRLTLYPQSTVERAQRAHTLLTKVLQLIQGFGFHEREVRYLLIHAADFDGLNLSHLPTCAADDSLANAITLFKQFLRLVNYAQLKATLAGDTDDLISIFEQARRTFPTTEYTTDQAVRELFVNLCQRLAELTRRDAQTIQEVASHLGFLPTCISNGDYHQVEAPDFAQEKGIQYLWDVLQVVYKIGVPVASLARWATPAPDFAIARDLRDTVKARYEPENWQRIAQPIFDPLRQRQRDALVAYVLAKHPEGFKNPNQLFEYFLIDPGMEPVVQTSRIRLAISAVQTFIQRCLLNLEPQVRPSAINTQHWQWMNRYRVWEANRKIFLYPENWLEPEFRDDKTHLFQELESALLQGDVSNELAETAFFNYLKTLEEIANLEIVTMYCQERVVEGENLPETAILHVIGRNANIPHQYFYRRYADGMWTPWEPVTTSIEGDHIVAAMWKGRLHLFWVTFMEEAETTEEQPPDDGEGVGDKSVSAVASDAAALTQNLVKVSLNWCEYFQGQWTTPESSGFILEQDVTTEFSENSNVFIYVLKESDSERIDGTLRINLRFVEYVSSKVSGLYSEGEWRISFHALRLVSKNSKPERIETDPPTEPPLKPPYLGLNSAINHYTDSGSLVVPFGTEAESEPQTILQQALSSYSLVPYSNLSDIKFSNALENRFFYRNNLHTFFVEPSLTFDPPRAHETSCGMAGISWEDLELDKVPVEPELEAAVPPEAIGPILDRPPRPIFSGAKFAFQTAKNWPTDPVVFVEYDGGFISQGGRYEPPEGVASTELRSVEGRVVVGGNGLRPSAIEVLNAEPETIRKFH